EFAWVNAIVAGVPAKLARFGYTGEDGFEIYAENGRIGEIWDGLMDAGKEDGLVPVGLGARDTLRLEARMPLYGQELGDDISPYEAGLGWAVNLEKGDLIAREKMAEVKANRPANPTAGFQPVGRGGSPRTQSPAMLDGADAA